MRKVSILLPTLALSLSLGSCSLLPFGQEEAPTEQQPQTGTPAPAPAPKASNSDMLTPTTRASVFIPATDPDARRRVNVEGRPDPFADIPTTPPRVVFAPEPPPEEVETTNQAVPTVPQMNGGGTTGGATPVANGGTAGTTAGKTGSTATANGTTNGGRTLIAVRPPAKLEFSPILPELPKAELAENTEITGVIELNGVKYVLAKAPNEKYSRQVQVGDFIADGQVRIKRVDFRRNSPVVVLEQYGVEVYKQIDDVLLANREPKPATPEKPAS